MLTRYAALVPPLDILPKSTRIFGLLDRILALALSRISSQGNLQLWVVWNRYAKETPAETRVVVIMSHIIGAIMVFHDIDTPNPRLLHISRHR